MAVGTLPKTIDERPSAEPAPERAPSIIRLCGLSKTFRSKGGSLTVFDGLSCEIEKRSFLSIIGPSGCGKSTLLKLISGLETPTAGEILFNERQVESPPKGMIYVFQQYTKSILPWRTVI